jgi:hypothetical protein
MMEKNAAYDSAKRRRKKLWVHGKLPTSISQIVLYCNCVYNGTT